jgi:hypothetical protein
MWNWSSINDSLLFGSSVILISVHFKFIYAIGVSYTWCIKKIYSFIFSGLLGYQSLKKSLLICKYVCILVFEEFSLGPWIFFTLQKFDFALIKNLVRINRNFSRSNSGKIRFLKIKVVFQDKKKSIYRNRNFYWRAKQEIKELKKKREIPKKNSS